MRNASTFVAIALTMFSAGCCNTGKSDPAPEPAISVSSLDAAAPPNAMVVDAGEAAIPEMVQKTERKSDSSRCNMPNAKSARVKDLFSKARQLKSEAELASLMSNGRAGSSERIAIQVNGAFGAGCECPPFSAWFSEPNEGFAPVLTIPAKGVIDVGLARPNLRAIFIGYFSGANIDTYEYFHAIGEEAPEPDDEERHTWLELHPEFCLDAWCYAIPDYQSDPEDDDAGADYVRFLLGVSAEDAARYAKMGVMKCKAEWMQKQ